MGNEGVLDETRPAVLIKIGEENSNLKVTFKCNLQNKALIKLIKIAGRHLVRGKIMRGTPRRQYLVLVLRQMALPIVSPGRICL